MPKDLSFKLLNSYLIDFLSLKFRKHPFLRPLFFTHYLTLRCNFRCSYCPFSRSRPDQESQEMDTEDTIRFMRIIVRECPNIYFTGGEPLLRSDLIEILRAGRSMGFKSISINTNMSLIHKKMGILDHISNLVASLDSVDEERYSKILGVSIATVRQAKDNIIECSKLQKKKNFIMSINCVIIPETIGDVRELMAFCFRYNIRLAVVPAELDGGGVDPRLKTSVEYRRLIEDIIREKKNGRPIFGSLGYLKSIYDFKRFDCYPTLTPHTYPDGSLFYPCQPMSKVAANLLKTGSYRKALRMGIKRLGPLPMCRDKCHKACYIEPSNFIKNPFLLLTELIGIGVGPRQLIENRKKATI